MTEDLIQNRLLADFHRPGGLMAPKTGDEELNLQQHANNQIFGETGKDSYNVREFTEQFKDVNWSQSWKDLKMSDQKLRVSTDCIYIDVFNNKV